MQVKIRFPIHLGDVSCQVGYLHLFLIGLVYVLLGLWIEETEGQRINRPYPVNGSRLDALFVAESIQGFDDFRAILDANNVFVAYLLIGVHALRVLCACRNE